MTVTSRVGEPRLYWRMRQKIRPFFHVVKTIVRAMMIKNSNKLKKHDGDFRSQFRWRSSNMVWEREPQKMKVKRRSLEKKTPNESKYQSARHRSGELWCLFPFQNFNSKGKILKHTNKTVYPTDSDSEPATVYLFTLGLTRYFLSFADRQHRITWHCHSLWFIHKIVKHVLPMT
jgi:hypothetical protein